MTTVANRPRPPGPWPVTNEQRTAVDGACRAATPNHLIEGVPYARFLYTGPDSAVTLKVSDGKGNLNDQDVLLWNNQEVELPADHDMVHVLVEKGRLTRCKSCRCRSSSRHHQLHRNHGRDREVVEQDQVTLKGDSNGCKFSARR